MPDKPIDHPAVQAAMRTALLRAESRAGALAVLEELLAPALEQLLADETARCAKIAESHGCGYCVTHAGNICGRDIAAAIRKGATSPVTGSEETR